MLGCKGFLGLAPHCYHMETILVDNPHGPFQPEREEKVKEDFLVCCKCGRKIKPSIWDYS